VGVSENYAVFGGPIQSDAGRATYNPGVTDINVLDRTSGLVIPIAQAAADGASDFGYTDVNNAGQVCYHGWPDPNDPVDPNGGRIMLSDVSSGTATVPIVVDYTDQTSAGDRLRISTYNDRISYRKLNSGGQVNVYDISDATAYNVWTAADLGGALGVQKAYKPAISDDGKWIATNMRYANLTATWNNASDIVLIDVEAGIAGTPVQYNVTGDNVSVPPSVRNDPAIEMVDADTALIVWDDNVGGKYNVRAAYVTGLSTGTPVMGSMFWVAQSAYVDLKYADVDGNLVAWHNRSTGQVEYRIIPEPATLCLLGLGVLALARRR
jgi:hypothetical protein